MADAEVPPCRALSDPHWLNGQDQLTFKASEIPAKCTLCDEDKPIRRIPAVNEGQEPAYICERCLTKAVDNIWQRAWAEVPSGGRDFLPCAWKLLVAEIGEKRAVAPQHLEAGLD